MVIDGNLGSRMSREPGTVEHRQPRAAAQAVGHPALVVAFPASVALPLSGEEIVIGRDALADRGVVDAEVSGSHLRVRLGRGGFEIEDAGSRNGTWVDGVPLAPGERLLLGDGAIVRVGGTLLVHRDRLDGPLEPSPPIGELIAPYGMRGFLLALDTFARHPPVTVLIEGETGVGKELAATAIARALRRSHRYAAINVAGVAPGVFESQLFGHTAGAYSDARKAADGVVVAHAGGTVFLDEIGELPVELQPKLLRLLENREVLPVGADRARTVDVLLLAATNRDLEQLAGEGRFRHDLFARLAVARVQLPPLRERVEDLFAIVQVVGARVGRPIDPTSGEVEVEAVERLMLDPWPHNVRGVAALLGRLGPIDPEPGLHLWAVDRILGPRPASRPGHVNAEVVRATIDGAQGNEREAARRLGMSRGKLRRMLGKG
jgi:sigma-54 interacting transcriptional regulator/FHA domain-containing protein